MTDIARALALVRDTIQREMAQRQYAAERASQGRRVEKTKAFLKLEQLDDDLAEYQCELQKRGEL